MSPSSTLPHRFFRTFLKMYGWIGLFCLAFGSLAAGIGFSIDERARALANSGVSETAEILDKRIDSVDGNEYFYVTYNFSWNGQQVLTERRVTDEEYNQAKIGAQQMVWFLPGAPEEIDLSDNESSKRTIKIWRATLIILVFGIIATVVSARQTLVFMKVRWKG